MIAGKSPFEISRMTLFNLGVGIFIVTTAGVVLRHQFIKEQAPLCQARYQNAMVYPWSRSNGQPFTSADLQGKLGGFDWGVLENVRFVGNAPVLSKVAIEIGLPKDPPTPANAAPATKKSGVGFAWQPARIKDATSACLSYDVYLPADIDPASGISLPGLFGNDDNDPLGDRAAAFSTRMRWREDGRLDLVNANPDGVASTHPVDHYSTKLPRGRWTRIEQEITLNTPGRKDGMLRVWVDGDMKIEQTNVVFRQDGAHGFRGVDASVHYSRNNHAWAPSPKDTLVRLSPFEIRWK